MKNAKYIEKNPKYKKGDFVKLIENNLKVENLVHILDVNDELKSPDYYIEAFNIKTQEIVKIWIDEEEIDKKTNAKGKIKFK
jgi:hypothetical protein